MKGLRGLRSLLDGSWILVKLYRELKGLRRAQERVAAALEFANNHEWPAAPAVASSETNPAFEVTYVSEDDQREWMETEMRLAQATGRMPTEDEIMEQYAKDHPDPAGTQADA